MTGYQSKKDMAQDKLDDDDIQVYQRPWIGLTDDDMKDPKTHNFDFIYGARWAEAKLKERNA